MKIASAVARYLLGFIFFVFGLNGFLHFLPSPPPSGLAGQFVGAMFVSHYLSVVFAFELAAGILLLINRYVPLALTVLTGMIINIDLTHITMAPSGLPMAAVVSLLWLLVFLRVRSNFAGIFEPAPQR